MNSIIAYYDNTILTTHIEKIGYFLQNNTELEAILVLLKEKYKEITDDMISKIERGKHDIKITELERISFGLETSIKVLVVEI